jgi:NitT/TauT family transport system substrate-binding protein
MWNRRRTLQTGLAMLLSAAAPLRAFSQPKPRVKVRYNEVVRSMLYTPAYVAIAKGYFDELGMDVTLATAQGGDKSVAIMLSNQADIALIGPESAIYVQNSDSPVKIPIFCGLTATDGFMLVGREKVAKLTGACSRARRSWASGPAARRCSFWRRRCVRTGSIRKRTSSS